MRPRSPNRVRVLRHFSVMLSSTCTSHRHVFLLVCLAHTWHLLASCRPVLYFCVGLLQCYMQQVPQHAGVKRTCSTSPFGCAPRNVCWLCTYSMHVDWLRRPKVRYIECKFLLIDKRDWAVNLIRKGIGLSIHAYGGGNQPRSSEEVTVQKL